MLTYKKGFYTIDSDNYKCYDVFKDGVKVAFISKDEVLNEWFAYKDINSDYLCGGLTLKEVKETLENRVFNKQTDNKMTKVNDLLVQLDDLETMTRVAKAEIQRGDAGNVSGIFIAAMQATLDEVKRLKNQ